MKYNIYGLIKACHRITQPKLPVKELITSLEIDPEYYYRVFEIAVALENMQDDSPESMYYHLIIEEEDQNGKHIDAHKG